MKFVNERKKLEMPGIEPGASYMQSMRSTTELHPLIENNCRFISNNQKRQVIEKWNKASKFLSSQFLLPI